MIDASMIMLVMSAEHRWAFLDCIASLNVGCWCADDCQQALSVLKAEYRADVIVTDAILSNGTWRDIQRFVFDNDLPTVVIVVSADEDLTFCSTTLSQGVYDMLTWPCSCSEICDSIEGALRGLQAVNETFEYTRTHMNGRAEGLVPHRPLEPV